MAGQPSEWVVRWVGQLGPLLPAPVRALDLACGNGRHARTLHQLGYCVTAVDRDPLAMQNFDASEKLVADLETADWPLAGREFDLIVVTHYLHRPHFANLLACLAPGGVLIYETFAAGNAMVGKPSNPDFLLQPGELLRRCVSLRVVAYEDGFASRAKEAFLQRICAVRATNADDPVRYPLEAAPLRP